MKDQAEKLRYLASSLKTENTNTRNKEKKTTRVIAVTSGKGGVGKTNFTVNIALALRNYQKKVLVLDADLGLANVDVILSISPKTSLGQVIRGEKQIEDVIFDGPNGLQLIAGGSGVQELANLSDSQLNRFIANLNQLDGKADFILIDTGAGLTRNVLSFVLAADEVIVVTTPEPTSLTDAYAIIKVIAAKNRNAEVNLVVNRTQTLQEGEQTAKKLSLVSKHFLDFELCNLGEIPDDSVVSTAVRNQQPFLLAYPQSEASKCVMKIASCLVQQTPSSNSNEGIKSFFTRMVGFFK